MSIVARLSALLTANTSGFESGLARANRATGAWKNQTNSALSQAGRSFDNFNRHVQTSIGGVVDLKSQLGGLATAAASALSVQKIIQYSDAWKQMQSRLSLVTKDTKELNTVTNALFEISKNNSTPVQDTADAYVRLANSTSDAQKQQYNMLEITDLLAKTLKISGTNAQGAATFLQQFGQAASNDFKAIGQELQTFADQNPTFYKIIRDEAAKTGMSLKDFAASGGLSFSFVADAMKKSSDRIVADSEKISLTVSQALTQLDNAFLKFIGQSDMIASGTSSLALGITTLADNFGELALAVAAVAVVMGARFVSSLVTAGTASAKAFLASSSAAAANTAALNMATAAAGSNARMAAAMTTAQRAAAGAFATSTIYVNRAGAAVVANTTAMSLAARGAALSMTVLGAASTALGTAFAFLGGPVGVAIIGTMALMAQEMRVATIAQDEMNASLEKHRDAVARYIYADAERRKAIRDSTRANIESMMSELKAQQELFAAYQARSTFGKFIQNLRLPGTEGNGVDAIVKRGAALENGIQEMQDLLAQMDQMDATIANGIGSGAGAGGGAKKKDVYKDILKNLRDESAELEIQTRMFGSKEAAIERATAAMKIQNQLADAGVKLTQAQQAEITKYLESIEKQTALQKEQTDQQKKLEEQERDREQALNQLGATFESAFEKAISDGEKLSDVLDSLLDDIVRLMTRLVITEPLTNAITDMFKGGGNSSGGGGGGFLSGLFDWLPSFDVGTNKVPRDMIAQIHKGEMIVPAYDADKIRNGGSGAGGPVNINIVNNAGVDVKATQTESGNGTDILVTIERAVAEGINRSGSPINQSLKAFNNKTLVRR